MAKRYTWYIWAAGDIQEGAAEWFDSVEEAIQAILDIGWEEEVLADQLVWVMGEDKTIAATCVWVDAEASDETTHDWVAWVSNTDRPWEGKRVTQEQCGY